MKKIGLVLLVLLLVFGVHAQEKLSGEYHSSDQTVDPEQFDTKLLSEIVLQEINMFMDSLGLEGFEKYDFLVPIARDHAAEMAENNNPTTKGKGKTKNIASRIQYYGGSGVGDAIVMRYNLKTTEGFLTYREIARGIILKWSSSVKTLRNLRKQQFFLAGVGSALDERQKKVYVSFMMGNYFTKNEGADMIKEIEPNVSTGGLFPFWRWGVDNYEYLVCRNCKKYFPDLIDLQKGLSINEKGEIVFKYNDLRRFNRLIRRKKDGLAVDIVRKSQFNNCNSPNIVDYSLVNRGIMLKPVYKKKLMKKNRAPAEGKRERVKKLEVVLGEFPEELNPEETELNLMILQDKHVCYNLPPSFVFDAQYEYSQKIGLLPDTIVPEGVPAYKPVATTNKLEFHIPFERNKYTYEMEDIAPVIEALNEPDFIINKVYVEAYSSLEGSIKANKELQENRAESIIDAFRKNQNANIIDSITAAPNWEDFKKDVKDTKHKKLADMSMDEAIEYINDNKLAKELEPILENHRYADISIWITYDLTEGKEEYYVVDQFNKAIKNGDKARALSIQKYMYDQLVKGKYGKTAVENMEIPEGKKYVGLNMNRICMEQILYDDVIDKSYHDKIEMLWELDKENPYVYYNYVYCRVLLEDVTNQYDKEILQDEISYLYDFDLRENVLDLLNIELQYKVMDIYADSVGIDHPVVEKSLDMIKRIINFDEVNWQNSLKLAVIYLNHGDYDYAFDLVKHYADDEDVYPELLYTYISLCSKVDHKIHSNRFARALEKAEKMDNQRFCDFFRGDKSFPSQVFANEKVKELYCDHCK
jgi:uncharacterized protein YkwD